MNKLLKKAKQLEMDALEIFSDLKLDKFFADFGEVKLVGSVTYGLMSWEDLDIDLITKAVPDDELFWKTAKFLMKNKNTKLLLLADNRNGQKELNRPKSIYLGVKYIYQDSVEWKIDIRLIQKEEVQVLPDWMRLIDKLDGSRKLVILMIKDSIKENPEYHKTISSMDVYDAVINQEIDSFEAFMKWVKGKGKKVAEVSCA